MGLFTKGPKKEKEPQYYRSATNIKTINYKVYYMKPLEKVLCFLAAFAVGAAVGYLFYGGIGKDIYGRSTSVTWFCDIFFSGLAGFIAGKAFLPIRTNMVINSRRKKLNAQFRDMLEAFNTSLGAGNNVPDSFMSVYEDLKLQH
jgi:tight adherence protein B